MKTVSYKTRFADKELVKRDWWLVDADAQVVGRIASKIASLLRGKHKAYISPNFDSGDYVVVVNSRKVRFTGKKWLDKEYHDFSGYPGGQKTINPKDLNVKKPEALIERAVKGMLPKTKQGRAMFKKLFVYGGAEHPHTAQKLKPFKVNL